MDIFFIYHSCFVARSETALIVYDYWKDNGDSLLHRLIAERGERQLYFVVSHFHEDHYNAEILEFPEARLLVSYDTSKRRHIKSDVAAAVLHPGELYEDENLKLNALRSTDVGISTLTTLPDGTTLYHAGDNNNWYFPENESEHIKCTLDEMEGMFISNLREVRSLTKSVDYVMFPVDPRLGSEMLRGACQWLQQVKTARFYPMHCWEDYETVAKCLSQLKDLFPETIFV